MTEPRYHRYPNHDDASTYSLALCIWWPQCALNHYVLVPEALPDPTLPVDGRARVGDPDTSRQAARVGTVTRGKDRAHILEALSVAWCSDYELTAIVNVSRVRPIERNAVATRRRELVGMGLVEAVSGWTRPTDTNTPAQVWCITDKGRRVLEWLGEHRTWKDDT